MLSFKILFRNSKPYARTGIITTSHGTIRTPAFIPVGTQASVKALSSEEIAATGTQMFFVNTYHMYIRSSVATVKKMGGLHSFMKWHNPIITDSGGFQVFSLGRKDAGSLVKIYDDRVVFKSHLDGSLHEFTPEKSLDIQRDLGADIILPLDECPPHPVTKNYANQALIRTHKWAKDSFDYFNAWKSSKQSLYGIVQGSIYEDLRKKSAEYIATIPFNGFAIGGVSVGESKDEMQSVCDWTIPYLPEDKPRHLLGVGELDDIFEAIERGVDTFDCVMPTRIARMGHILITDKLTTNSKFQKQHEIDINKAEFKDDSKPLDPSCDCWVCNTYTRSYIHHLFRSRELLGYRLTTYHNVYFVHALTARIRTSIENGTFFKVKEQFLQQ